MAKRWYIKKGVLSRSQSKDATVFEVDGAATEIVIPDGVICPLPLKSTRRHRSWVYIFY